MTPNITLPNAGPTSYVLNVIDNLGCTAQDQIVVNASNVFPQLSNIPDQYTCPGKSVLLDGQVVSSGQSFVYEWLGGDLYFENQLEDALVSPFSTTQYTFHVTDPLYGCTSTKDVMVFVDETQGPKDLEIEFPFLPTDQINGQVIYPCNTFFDDGQQQVNYQTIKIDASTSEIQFDWYLSYNRFDASTFLSSDKSLNLPWTQNEFLTGIVTNQDGCKAKKEIQILPDLIMYKASEPQYGLINQLFDVKCEVTNQIGYTSRWSVGNLETSTNSNEFGDINSISTTFTPTNFYWPFGVTRYLWNYVDNGHGCTVQIPAQVINVYEPNNNYYYPESMLQYNNFDGLAINSPCAGIAGNGNSPLNYNCFSLQGSPFTFKENPYFLSSVATSRGFKIGQQIEPWTSFITHIINPNNTAWDFNSPNCGYNNQPGAGTLDLFYDLPWNHSFYLTANLEYYPVLGVLPHINVCNAPSPVMLHKYWASEIGYYGYPGLDIYAMNIDIGTPLNSFYCDGDFISENSTDIQGNNNLRIFAGNEININPGNYTNTGFNATAGVGGGEFYAGINECLFQFPARIRNPILSRGSYTNALNSKPSITGVDVLSVYPNPTTDLINVEFSLPEEQKIILEIANQYGSPVANIVTGTYKGFKIVVSADQLSLKPAVYFVILKTHGQTFAKRFSIVK